MGGRDAPRNATGHLGSLSGQLSVVSFRVVQGPCLRPLCMRRRVSDEEAVSPVIATVLLLAITVLLTSMVFIMFQGALSTTEKSPPQASTSVKGLENGFHVVRLSSLDQALDPAAVRYTLYNSSSGTVEQGYLVDNDVYGVVGAPVSFHDRDAGYSVTQGDYLVISSEDLGADEGGWRLQLVDERSGVVLVDVRLPAIVS